MSKRQRVARVAPKSFSGKKGQRKNDPIVECIICWNVIPREKRGKAFGGIMCNQRCYVCEGECSKRFVKSNVNMEYQSKFMRCSVCTAPIKKDQFEKYVLDSGDETMIGTYFSMIAVMSNPELKIQSCITADCTHFQIRDKKEKGFFSMQCEVCGVAYCTVCDKVCRWANDDEDQEVAVKDPTCFCSHFADTDNSCAALAEDKAAIEYALQRGMGAECPKCGTIGRKDTECTHIHCSAFGCKAYFCYFCEKVYKDLDKIEVHHSQRRKINMSRHNANWEFDENRCPALLCEMHDVDPRWPADDTQAVEFLSRHRTLTLLRVAVEKMGLDRFKELCTKYASILNCGFNIEEIMAHDQVLFIRMDPRDAARDDAEAEARAAAIGLISLNAPGDNGEDDINTNTTRGNNDGIYTSRDATERHGGGDGDSGDEDEEEEEDEVMDVDGCDAAVVGERIEEMIVGPGEKAGSP